MLSCELRNRLVWYRYSRVSEILQPPPMRLTNDSSALMTKATGFFGSAVQFYQAPRCHIPGSCMNIFVCVRFCAGGFTMRAYRKQGKKEMA